MRLDQQRPVSLVAVATTWTAAPQWKRSHSRTTHHHPRLTRCRMTCYAYCGAACFMHEHDKMIARGVGHAFALFSVSRRLRALSKILVTDLRLAPWKSSTRPRDDGSTGLSTVALAGHRTTSPAYSLSQSGSLLAPFGWAARLSSLRALQISWLTSAWRRPINHATARVAAAGGARLPLFYSLSRSLGDDAEHLQRSPMISPQFFD